MIGNILAYENRWHIDEKDRETDHSVIQPQKKETNRENE